MHVHPWEEQMQQQPTYSAKVLAINVHQQPLGGLILQEGSQSSPEKNTMHNHRQFARLFDCLALAATAISSYFASVCSNF
jgi:hypothetical protein